MIPPKILKSKCSCTLTIESQCILAFQKPLASTKKKNGLLSVELTQGHVFLFFFRTRKTDC
jgi:hypothetical protein